MNIFEELSNIFPSASAASSPSDDFIVANPNIMELSGHSDLLQVVPAYLLWCASHADDVSLVSDFTLHALAEYGRCRSPQNSYLNFLFLCSTGQRQAVAAFLSWASVAFPFHNEVQLKRAIRNWQNATEGSEP